MANATIAAGTTAPARAAARAPIGDATWAVLLVAPYAAVFVFFVIYPVAYGFWLGSGIETYEKLFADPLYARGVRNTLVFLLIGVNLKMFLALVVSGFFVHPQRWIRWLSILFILPWAVPSIPTILSFRWMLNSEWGMVNEMLFQMFGIFPGPGWLLDADLAMGSIIFVHVWKYLPFWTLIMLAGRMAIARDLYEAAAVDGASGWQRFKHVTWPGLRRLYLTSTLLSIIWSLGDFNSIYLLTGGAPLDRTHTLATLGIRFGYQLSDVATGVATVITALPLVIPIVIYLVRNLGREADA